MTEMRMINTGPMPILEDEINQVVFKDNGQEVGKLSDCIFHRNNRRVPGGLCRFRQSCCHCRPV